MHIQALFPELAEKSFLHVDLDYRARSRQERAPQLVSTAKENPFLDAAVCAGFVGAPFSTQPRER